MFRRLLSLLFLTAAACRTTLPPDPAIATYLKHAETLGFDGQVVIERDGAVIHDGAYGFADREHGARVSPVTIFNIASESKQFTATAILRLESDGKLKVTDTIDRWLDDVPADKRDITVHQLLTHTSGLPQGDIINDFEPVEPKELIRKILAQERKPAGIWRYSNAGYNLLAAIIERASGMSYRDYMHKAIFDAVGLTHTGIYGIDSARFANAATAYRGFAAQGSVRSWGRNMRTWGAGDVFSTAEDLVRFAWALREGRIIPPAQYAKMIARHVKLPGDDNDIYGYAWFVGDSLLEHGGDTEPGFSCTMRYYPKEKITLVLTSNRTEVNGVWLRWGVQDGIAFLAGVKGKVGSVETILPDVHDAGAMPADGIYTAQDGGRLSLHRDGGRQLIVEALDPKAAIALWNVAADAEKLQKAVVKTTAMLDALRAGRVHDAFADALPGDGAPFVGDYVQEWETLTAAHGTLRSFEVRGAIPMKRGAARVYVALGFERGNSVITYSWRDKGDGRLVGSSPGEGPPLARVFAAGPGGEIMTYEFGSKTTLPMSVTAEGLAVGGVTFHR